MTSKEALEKLLGRAMSKPYVGMIVAALEKDLDKLDQYETIEKELGVDLITLFKALKDGIWVKNEFGQIYYTNVYLYDFSLSQGPSGNRFCFLMGNEFLFFCDYGKSWALTKEELEKNETK